MAVEKRSLLTCAEIKPCIQYILIHSHKASVQISLTNKHHPWKRSKYFSGATATEITDYLTAVLRGSLIQ